MVSTAQPARLSALSIFLIFLRLGLTCFGGPVAHIGFFRDEFVRRRAWLSDEAFADIVALCQFMPGPSSSQVGIALGLRQGGLRGAVVAWLGFTLPSAALLCAFGLAMKHFGSATGHGWLQGLQLVAVAVVAQALWSMARTLCPDMPRLAIALVALVLTLSFHSPFAQVAVLLAGALGGLLLRTRLPAPSMSVEPLESGSVAHSGVALVLFGVLLCALPIVATASGNYALHLFSSFFRVGSLVFGGGHVVLPLLESVVVPSGWVTADAFIAGYGAAQAVPGPLFTFAAFLGSVSSGQPAGIVGAAIAVVAIFLPSFLLVIGVLPWWDRVRTMSHIRFALMGVNAAVVGLLASAFYSPLWVNAIRSVTDFALAVVALLLLTKARLPPWLIVGVAAAAGYFLL
ncbi:MAG: chromate efflux transporter [Paraburkholderia sp.]|nr:chromate efflux transporter [Paraburkholderia sp.]